MPISKAYFCLANAQCLPQGHDIYAHIAIGKSDPFRQVAVINVAQDGWMRFRTWIGDNVTGVMFPPSPQSLIVVKHCLSVVGWGTDETGAAFWIVQNSFGPEWGEHGFARLSAGGDWGLEKMWFAPTYGARAPAPVAKPTDQDRGVVTPPQFDGSVVAWTLLGVFLLSLVFVATYDPVSCRHVY